VERRALPATLRGIPEPVWTGVAGADWLIEAACAADVAELDPTWATSRGWAGVR
jgi:hypothetical protein